MQGGVVRAQAQPSLGPPCEAEGRSCPVPIQVSGRGGRRGGKVLLRNDRNQFSPADAPARLFSFLPRWWRETRPPPFPTSLVPGEKEYNRLYRNLCDGCAAKNEH